MRVTCFLGVTSISFYDKYLLINYLRERPMRVGLKIRAGSSDSVIAKELWIMSAGLQIHT